MPVHLFAGSFVYSFVRSIDVYVFMKLCSSFIREIGFAACVSSVRTLICTSYSSPMLGIVINDFTNFCRKQINICKFLSNISF